MEWGLILILVLSVVLFVWLHPDERRERRYKRLLADRNPVDDVELFAKHFAAGEVAPEIPGRVRKTFAAHMSYPAEKMLPDDDLTFYWSELDMIDLVRELEADFGIEISDADAEHTKCNIRSVSQLVEAKRIGFDRPAVT